MCRLDGTIDERHEKVKLRLGDDQLGCSVVSRREMRTTYQIKHLRALAKLQAPLSAGSPLP